MSYRSEIERALDEVIAQESGMRFQNLAVALATRRWPFLIPSDRRADGGLDAFGPAMDSPDGVNIGVSCSITASWKKISDDATEAAKHYPPLGRLIFMTPRPVGRRKQEEWIKQLKESCQIELTLLSREYFVTELQLSDNEGIARTVLYLSTPYEAVAGRDEGGAQRAAKRLAEAWAARTRGFLGPQIDVTAVSGSGGAAEGRAGPALDLIGDLATPGARISVEAPAGRGKTSTLVRFALRGAATTVPLLVDVPAWLRSGRGILEYIAERSEFLASGIDRAALARASRDCHFIFLLDGWNEIPQRDAHLAGTHLRELERDLPSAAVVVASRPLRQASPLSRATQLRLEPLSQGQRREYINGRLPANEARVLDQILSGDRGLHELSRTPLILSSMVDVYRAGMEIPRTRMGLLWALMRVVEDAGEHRDQLESASVSRFWNEYLEDLAVDVGASFGEAAARACCLSTAESLRVSRQIASVPEPADVLRALAAHHVLEVVDGASPGFRFQHQQFQEFYAARVILRDLRSTVPSGDPDGVMRFAEVWINQPRWEEPLRMVAEELGNDPDGALAGRELVLAALRLDPVFAGELTRLCGPAVWPGVETALRDSLRGLHQSGDRRCRRLALAAMMATGSTDFSDVIVRELTGDGQQDRLAAYRAGAVLRVSSLGVGWRETVGGWPEELRAEFVSELGLLQGNAGVARHFARHDTSLTVRTKAVEALAWVGQVEDAWEILRSWPDQALPEALWSVRFRQIPQELRDRARSAELRRVGREESREGRLHIISSLLKSVPGEASRVGKEELRGLLEGSIDSQVPGFVLSHSGRPWEALRGVVDELGRTEPGWIDEFATKRIGAMGNGWQDWTPLFCRVAPSLVTTLIRHACDRPVAASEFVLQCLGGNAGPADARSVFSALTEQRRLGHVAPLDEGSRQFRSQLESLYRAIPLPVLADALEELLDQEPSECDVVQLCERAEFSIFQSPPTGDLPDPQRQRMRAYFIRAATRAIAADPVDGRFLAAVSAGLATVGEPQDLQQAESLARADIHRWRYESSESGPRGTRRGGRMSYAPQHVGALVRLNPDGAQPVVRDLLWEESYEQWAAWGLFAASSNDPNAIRSVSACRARVVLDPRALRQGGDQWRAAFREPARSNSAAAIRSRVEGLMRLQGAEGAAEPAGAHRLLELAKPLAELDPHGSTDLLLDVTSIPNRYGAWACCDVLEGLIFAGVRLPASRVAASLTTPLEVFIGWGGWEHPSSPYQLGRALSVLPFVDPPGDGIARMRELMGEYNVPPEVLRPILSSLCQCGVPEALDLLCEIALRNEQAFEQIARDWVAAVSGCRLPRATSVLLAFVDPESPEAVGRLPLLEWESQSVVAAIAAAARSDPRIVERLAELTTMPLSPQQRSILMAVTRQADCSRLVVAALQLLHDEECVPIPYALRSAIQDAFIEKRPVSEHQGSAYTIVPRAANAIRERLYDMLRNDPIRPQSARELLWDIEELRLDHGRPASEPRHPAVESGAPWPPIPVVERSEADAPAPESG